MTAEFVTPVGRIVWGNPARATTKKDQKTKQPIMRDGKAVEQWVFGVAFTKQDFQQYVMPYLQQEVQSVFPHGVPPQFSWKFKDGDGVDRSGKPFNTREGYAGHFVLTVSTEAFAPPIYKNEGGKYRQLAENEIKCGDYVVVKLNVKANAPTNVTHTPGIYVNPVGLELVGYGQEIVSSGADPEEMFGGRTYQLPPGASATPQIPQTGATAPYNMPSTGGPVQVPQHYAPAVPLPPQQPPVYAATPSYPGQPPTQPLPPPAHDFVHNAGQQPPAPQYNAPAPMPQQYAASQATPVYPPQMPGIPTGR